MAIREVFMHRVKQAAGHHCILSCKRKATWRVRIETHERVSELYYCTQHLDGLRIEAHKR